MKKLSRKTLLTLVLALFILSCGKVEIISLPPTEEKESTSTVFLESTASPTIAITSTPTLTPFPTTPAQATIEAFDSLCIGSKKDFYTIGSKDIHGIELSPNGKWIAATCYWENGKEESPLQVSSLDHSQNWKIYYSDYISGTYIDKIGLSLDRHDGVIPSYWSKDGRFLFATVGSRLDGCCWIGGRYVLLVRLNLETGEQIALLNTEYYSANTFDFIISGSDRYLLFTPPSDQPYDFAILDFQTWETQEVFLKFQKDIDVTYAIMSPDEDKVILPLFKNLEFNDYYVDSIAMVNLITGEQDILISDIKPENELFPVQWKDSSHVLLSNVNPVYNVDNKEERLWFLDIDSGQIEEETP